MVALAIGLVLVSVLSSTRGDREAARVWLKPWEPWLLLATLFLLGTLFGPSLPGQPG